MMRLMPLFNQNHHTRQLVSPLMHGDALARILGDYTPSS